MGKEVKKYKSKKDLIRPLIFNVEGAEYSMKFKYGSNNVVGPGHSSWVTGAIPYSKFEVKSKENKIIKYLEFLGFTNLQKGDLIRAYVPKYGQEESVFLGRSFGPHNRVFYVERDFKETEKVSKIEKLSENGEILAVFKQSEDYD